MNTTLSFIYVHRNKEFYSYCNNLNTKWPFHWVWKDLLKELKECYCYAVFNQSFLNNSASGHSYNPVAILLEMDSLEEAKAINMEYFTGYMKIHEEDLRHLDYKNKALQEYVDTFAEMCLVWSDYKKEKKQDDDRKLEEVFREFSIADLFGEYTVDAENSNNEDDDGDEHLRTFFNVSV